MTNPIQTLASILRKTWNADDIIALRRELAPAYSIMKGPVPNDRRIGLWCKDKAAADKAAAFLQSIKLSYDLHFTCRDGREGWDIRFQGDENYAQTIIDRLEKTV